MAAASMSSSSELESSSSMSCSSATSEGELSAVIGEDYMRGGEREYVHLDDGDALGKLVIDGGQLNSTKKNSEEGTLKYSHDV